MIIGVRWIPEELYAHEDQRMSYSLSWQTGGNFEFIRKIFYFSCGLARGSFSGKFFSMDRDWRYRCLTTILVSNSTCNMKAWHIAHNATLILRTLYIYYCHIYLRNLLIERSIHRVNVIFIDIIV